MVTSKHRKTYEKHPFCGAHLSVNFWDLENDNPTTPIPLSRMLWAIFSYVDYLMILVPAKDFHITLILLYRAKTIPTLYELSLYLSRISFNYFYGDCF